MTELQPKPFFRWFTAIAEIPHGSGKEQKLADFLCAFAERRKLPCKQDEKGNVFMRVPASPGYEQEPPFLLQAHMDMIWKAEPGVDFDFETQPLSLYVEDGFLKARGTTLGADNAVGMATMLALADERERILHPPLELPFTVEEEIGLHGIRAFDMKKITARRMLGMDCGHTHELCIASPGKMTGELTQVFPMEPTDAPALRLELTGGFDGHLIGILRQGRACCETLLGEILEALDCRLVSIAQPTENCHAALTAVLAVPDTEAARAVISERFADFRARHAQDEAFELKLTDEQVSAALSAQDTARIAKMLAILRTGARDYYTDEIGGPKTTCAIQKLELADGKLCVFCLTRSFCDEDLQALYTKLQTALSAQGLTLPLDDSYSGWPGKADSPLRKAFEQAHRKVCGSDVSYYRILGGIEIGLITGAIPDMDAVGYAPTAFGAHSPRERLEIAGVQPYWDVLLEVLAQKT